MKSYTAYLLNEVEGTVTPICSAITDNPLDVLDTARGMLGEIRAPKSLDVRETSAQPFDMTWRHQQVTTIADRLRGRTY